MNTYTAILSSQKIILMTCISMWTTSVSYLSAQVGDDAYGVRHNVIIEESDTTSARLRHRSYRNNPAYAQDQGTHPTDERIIEYYKRRANEAYEEPPYYARVQSTTPTDTALIAFYKRRAAAAGRRYLEMNRRTDSLATEHISASRNVVDEAPRRRRQSRWFFRPRVQGWGNPYWGYTDPYWGSGFCNSRYGPNWNVGGPIYGWNAGPRYFGGWARNGRGRRWNSRSENRSPYRNKAHHERRRSTRRGGRFDRGR